MDVLGALIRGDLGADARFRFNLVDGGVVVGQTYDLIRFGSLQGFGADDFTLGGAAVGNFAFADGALSLTVTGVVPAPGVAGLLVSTGRAGGVIGEQLSRGRRPPCRGAPGWLTQIRRGIRRLGAGKHPASQIISR